jgi:signal transduction histidine kinase/ActR/RegA family two-component response regulator
MEPARLPPDEPQRLEALRQTGVLDTDPEESFDQLTSLAAQICGAPIALISLVDEDRQWFKSRQGLGDTQTAREIAFCAHAILEQDLTVVPDAAEDERFRENPLVRSAPGIRFYAGSPLRTHDGHALGTLCVVDTVPRVLEPRQERALRTLARHAAAQLELRRTMQRLRDELSRRLPRAPSADALASALQPLTALLRTAVAERDAAEVALRDLERQVHRVESFERVGRLAGGLAHDVNNLLTVVLAHAERLLERRPADPVQRESVQAIREAAELGSQLLRRVLALGSEREPAPQVIALDGAVQRTSDLLRLFLPASVEVVLRPVAPGVEVRMDPVQLEQVIVNLAVNSGDAMPSGGTLLLSTAVQELEESRARRLGGERAGAYATLSVTDTGLGMDEATLARSLQPFFTTKESGTGLGLANVAEIVRAAGGFLALSSNPGKGTRVDVYLPVLRASGESGSPPPVPRQGAAGTLRDSQPEASPSESTGNRERWPGAETLLVVDDDEAVRKLMVRYLDGQGFNVLAAPDATGALELARAHVDRLDLVVCDVDLPGMSGGRLVGELVAVSPDLAFLYVSGYRVPSPRALTLEDGAGRAIPFLSKPFSLTDLIRAVRAALERRRLTRRLPRSGDSSSREL